MAFRAGFEPFTKKPIKYWFLNILGASLPTLLPTSLYCHGYDLRVPPTGIISTRSGLCYGLKKIGSLRFRFGGMFAHAPCWRASSLIQSASYPRSASNIVCGSKALRRTEHSRLSCVSPADQPPKFNMVLVVANLIPRAVLLGGASHRMVRRCLPLSSILSQWLLDLPYLPPASSFFPGQA